MQAIEELKSDVRQYLILSLAGAEYAVDVAFVQELRASEKVTAWPSAPEFVRGVIKIRGMVVPVVDLRSCLALPQRADSPTTVFVVINFPAEDIVVALVVDAVTDVCGIDAQQISLNQGGAKQADLMPNAFVQGFVTQAQDTIALLDMHKLVHQAILFQPHKTIEKELVCA
ncbi:MAG: chemotaxis protein CheW [Mariprofundus sp.]|nr:chemotaxis protein CheW [Mariprofundus sp.]